MFKVQCRCGKTFMQFKNKIGDFYIEKCCEIAGYDHLGQKKVQEVVAEMKAEVQKVEQKVEQVLSRKERKALEAKALQEATKNLTVEDVEVAAPKAPEGS